MGVLVKISAGREVVRWGKRGPHLTPTPPSCQASRSPNPSFQWAWGRRLPRGQGFPAIPPVGVALSLRRPLTHVRGVIQGEAKVLGDPIELPSKVGVGKGLPQVVSKKGAYSECVQTIGLRLPPQTEIDQEHPGEQLCSYQAVLWWSGARSPTYLLHL